MSGRKSPHGFRFIKYGVPQYHLFLTNLRINDCTKRIRRQDFHKVPQTVVFEVLCVKLVLQEIFLQNTQKFLKIFFDSAVVLTMFGTKSPHGFRFGKYSVPPVPLIFD